jgi:phosphatidylinositol dimannoside acyltransferase
VTARSYRGSGRPGEPVDRRPGADRRIPPDPRPEGLTLRLQAVAWTLAWELARRLPERAAFGMGAFLGTVLHRLAPRARARVRSNLGRILPEAAVDAAARKAFRSYARYWVEAFRAADMPAELVDRRTTTSGFEHLDAALDRGRGAIVLLAHHGSWDVAARWAETHGYHLAVVAEVLRPRALFNKFVRLREAIGLEIVPLVPRSAAKPGAAERSQASMAARLSQVLEANHFVGLLSDRDLTGTAPVVRFFGEDTRIPPGPVVLAKRTRAPIVPATLLQRPGRRWHIEVLPALELEGRTIREGCRLIARALEDLVRLDPTQWHAFGPVWLVDVPEHRRGDWRPAAGAEPGEAEHAGGPQERSA